jgi:cyanophycinase
MRYAMSLLIMCLPWTATSAEVGPENGHLLIAGGDALGRAIPQKFVELAGGTNARLVIIPTASENWRIYNGDELRFQKLGVTNITYLHTQNRKTANTKSFNRPLQTATGVWFSGGRQWRLADAYLGTSVQTNIQTVLDRGGIVGGDSAGATFIGSYLVRGDTQSNVKMMGDHEVGLGLLKNAGIDQHLLRRNRQFDMVEVIEAKPHLLGIGIDESTAILVTGDRLEVVGASYVAIYDHETMKATKQPFFLLAPGQAFDLAKRELAPPPRFRFSK